MNIGVFLHVRLLVEPLTTVLAGVWPRNTVETGQNNTLHLREFENILLKKEENNLWKR